MVPPTTTTAPAEPPTAAHSKVVIYLTIAVWMVLNMSFSLVNKWLFSHHEFRFPIILVSSNLVATSVVLWIGIISWKGMKGLKSIWNAIQSQWKMLFIIAALTGSDLAFENASLVAVPVSLNQVVKSLGPVLLVLLSKVLERKSYSIQVYISTCILAVGTLLAVYRNPEGDFFGVMAAIISALLGTLKTIAAAVVMEKGSVSPLEIAASTSLPAVAFILPFFFVFEKPSFDSYLIEYPEKAAAAILGTSILAVFYNWIHFKLVGVIGSIASGIINVVKLPILILLSIYLWKTEVLWFNWVGMGLACCGFAMYQKYRPIGTGVGPTPADPMQPGANGYELVMQTSNGEGEEQANSV